MSELEKLKDFLDKKVEEYNTPDFLEDDPLGVPHQFKSRQDIEISGLMASVFAWGQRKTIINKSKEFLSLMDNSPHDFLLNHTEKDLKPFENFKHRTFNATDALYFIAFLSWHYRKYDSLEQIFVEKITPNSENIAQGLNHFFFTFFSLENAPSRTKKHVASPNRNSACKRLNMYLRWMVRKDDKGVDFGLWDKIKPSQLVCPCDVHVERVARELGLITRKPVDWKTAIELTNSLKDFDPNDPVKYDFALFGLGLENKF